MKKIFFILLRSIFISGVLMACSQSTENSSISRYADNPANLRLNLTDAPNDDLKNVFVKVDHFEILLERGGKQARLIVGKNLGMVDLLKLRDGVLMPIADVNIPQGVAAKQIRMVLTHDEHYAVRTDGSQCDMKTPSAQKTGVKFLIKQPIVFENNYNYSLVVDFDAKKSVVQRGNGECLLKPVLKLKSATRLPRDGDEGIDDEEMADGEDGNESEDPSDDGFEEEPIPDDDIPVIEDDDEIGPAL